MAFLTSLDRKLSEIGQGALRKTKDVSDTVKISSAIKDEENRQMDIFRQIGSYYYRTYANQAEGQMKTWCDSVAASQAMVRQYQEQLTILKGVAFCPNCNAEVPLTSFFCSNCGTKMPVKPPMAQINIGKACPSCGASITEGQMFCTNCGNRLPEISAGAVDREARRCRNCGFELAEGQAFCTNCGNRYEEQTSGLTENSAKMPVTPKTGEMPIAPEAGVISVMKHDEEETAGYDTMETADSGNVAGSMKQAERCCPSCGEELEEGQVFCINCGIKL